MIDLKKILNEKFYKKFGKDLEKNLIDLTNKKNIIVTLFLKNIKDILKFN